MHPNKTKTPMLDKLTLQPCWNCLIPLNIICVLNVKLNLLYFNVYLLLVSLNVILDSLITIFKLSKHYEQRYNNCDRY
jgi:hypothetical protein